MPLRLKSLELHGFKTFASQTSLEFPGMVTTIVGPNGSGKSNIADALRWVLGEQSFMLLRGRKTEDMIFAGSEFRPRAGLASATITFDNSDGWLPIDYSEVSITRRAFRDGQNEYLLNGQRVRLKEIAELLARSGLAERTYTIIGQGLVDAALALRPEDRRKLFEEAAGIGLYRTRKEETLRRLDMTHRNLERVQDILAELAPRIQSLEKQARKAMEYDQIKADLRLLLREWYGYQWHQHQLELAHVYAVLDAQNMVLDKARERQADLEKQASELRALVHEYRNRINQYHNESAQYHQKLEQTNLDLAILDERKKSLFDQRSRLENDVVKLTEELKALQVIVASAEEEFARVDTEIEESTRQAVESRKLLQGRLAEREAAEGRLRGEQQKLAGYERQKIQLTVRKDELNFRLEILAKNLASSRQSLEPLATGVDHAQQKYKESEAAVRVTQKVYGQSIQAQAEERQKLDAAESIRKGLLDQLYNLEGQLSQKQIRLDALVESENLLIGLGDGARLIVDMARKGKVKGGYSLLTRYLEVPSEHEIAIAAALGDLIDLVMLDELADVEDALDLIQSEGKGRAVLYKPARSLLAAKAPVFNDEGIIGLASDLVTCEPGFSAAIKMLLSMALVVKDRHCARRLLSDLPPEMRIVTLSGEVFHANGVVVSGKQTRTGLVGVNRQKKTLQSELAALQQKLRNNRGDINRKEAEIEILRRTQGSMTRQVEDTRDQLEERKQQQQRANLNVEQAKRQLDWQKKQIEEFEFQVVQSNEEVITLGQQITLVEESLTDVTAGMKNAQHELAFLPLDEMQAQVNHWDTVLAVSQQARQDSFRRLSEQKEALQNRQQQLNQYQSRLQDIITSENLIEKTRSDLKHQANDVTSKIETLVTGIAPVEKELAEQEEALNKTLETQNAAASALTGAERNNAQAQLEFSRQREALDSIRRRMEEDLGFVTLPDESSEGGQAPLPFEGLVEALPIVTSLSQGIDDQISRLRAQLRRLGAVNVEAREEYESVKERHEFLTSQMADLHKADADLRSVIQELDGLMRRDFLKVFSSVAVEFRQMFTRLFQGGHARLVLADEENPIETGIDIEARLPGRREQGLSLLSGGERSLTAVALIFALLKVSPTPFCVMDEVDAMLDEANVNRFCELLAELAKTTQFVLITHNRNTVQTADVIYGVTMGRDSSSQLISLKLDQVSDELVG